MVKKPIAFPIKHRKSNSSTGFVLANLPKAFFCYTPNQAVALGEDFSFFCYIETKIGLTLFFDFCLFFGNTSLGLV